MEVPELRKGMAFGRSAEATAMGRGTGAGDHHGTRTESGQPGVPAYRREARLRLNAAVGHENMTMNLNHHGRLAVFAVILCSSCATGPLEKHSVYGRANYAPNGQIVDTEVDAGKRWLWQLYPYREQSVYEPMIKRCHGRLFLDGKEVLATNIGERVEVPSGTYVWRGPVGGKPLDHGTGWNFDSNSPYHFGPVFR